MNRDELPQMLAAGGLVLCGGYALLIRKHGKWDIPKGKLKEYEPLDQCAVREIAEETGLQPGLLSIRAPLCRSSYISYYSGIPMNKTVSWYLLDYAGQLTDALTPDLTEDIDLCQWVPVTDLVETLEAARRYLGPVRQPIRQYLSAPVVLSDASVA
jgi:8-oxo-dGTP pyrophosphatase MutT (NUDIX family)